MLKKFGDLLFSGEELCVFALLSLWFCHAFSERRRGVRERERVIQDVKDGKGKSRRSEQGEIVR